MNLKQLMRALERASLDYAATGTLDARQRALQLIDELRDTLMHVEDALCSLPEPIRHGRKFVGIELKPSYYATARKNLDRMIRQSTQATLFDFVEGAAV